MANSNAGVWTQEPGEYQQLSVVCGHNCIRFVYKGRRKCDPMRRDPDLVWHCGSENLSTLNLLMRVLWIAAGEGRKETAELILPPVWSECFSALEKGPDSRRSAPICLLEEILEYIERHLDEPVNCDLLGRKFRVSGNYISQLFARHMSSGFSEYLTEQRMKLARHFLLHSQLNVGEISEHCGFTQCNYFIRIFSRRFGTTPLRYRMNHSGEKGAEEDCTAPNCAVLG
ncbi:MAG: helix-turn-helix domain-containing protein [Victivallaceae bacterium]|nr:helix-turn-helix domain-containing protein [Victivallaceae bacterium]